MTSRLLYLNRMMMKERLAINLLRGAYPHDLEAADVAAFDKLRSLARLADLALCAPDNTYIGRDEIKLMAWLAVLQRQRPLVEIACDSAFREQLRECARRLNALGVRLEFHVATRAHGFAFSCSEA